MEGKIYKLDNPYLTTDQKVIVETWFQLPGGFMEYGFWIMAVLSVFYEISIWYIFGISILLNILAGCVNWFYYSKRSALILGLSLFHPWVTGLMGVGVAIFLFAHGLILLSVISAFVGIFGFLFLEIHIFLYSFFAQKYKLHPKYVFAKKQFGLSLPFEVR